ncbi:jerky protein homolog [Hyperolius riggenbachi]|uniref:jerky protein homolog n=1 Tax=Hyperolius riggenbachi TaxID=752182 RepID=UPI0035A2B7A3
MATEQNIQPDSTSHRPPRCKRKRIVLTLKQKMEICQRLEEGVSRTELMEEFNVGSSTIYDIKSKSEKIRRFYLNSESDESVERRHTLHTPKMETLDQALYEWFLMRRSEGGFVSGPMLQEKAKELHARLGLEGQCNFSTGWLSRFKIRHGIRKPDLSGEQKTADIRAAPSFLDVFNDLVEEHGLTPERIYNAEETGIMWKCVPDSALAGDDEEVANGLKQNKERLTLIVCANASGNHKLKLSVIGKLAKPRSLKGITNLPVDYHHAQCNSWRDSDILKKWFHCSFVPSVKENLQNQAIPEDSKVLLLLDGSRTNPPAEELVDGNIFVRYLPSHLTSLVQPMDQGVIQNLQMFYRRDFMRKMINADDTVVEFQKRFNLKDAIYTASCAWDSVTKETLHNSWRKLWPSVIPAGSSASDQEESPIDDAAATTITVYDEICELVDSADRKIDVSRDELSSWLAVDEAIPVTLNSDDITEAVIKRERTSGTDDEESDDDVCEVEPVSWEKAIDAFHTLITFAEQQPCFTSQHVMQLLNMQNLTLEERRKASKEVDLRSFFQKTPDLLGTAASSSDGSPKASTSPNPDPASPSSPGAISALNLSTRETLSTDYYSFCT